MPKLVVLLGHPVRHSISPLFQQAAFDAVGLPYRYRARDVPPGRLPTELPRLRNGRYAGANVTIPYKEEAFGLVDAHSRNAEMTGAVNTIVVDGPLLVGHNTDVEGFRRAVEEVAGVSLAGRRAAIIGAGGAARAVCLALAQIGVQSVAVVNRTPERAARLADELQERIEPALHAVPLRDSVRLHSLLARCDVVVNCSPVGMAGHDGGALPIDPAFLDGVPLVVDIIANPVRTRLLEEAARRGARVLGGLPMLVLQGATSFRLWTGREAPLAVMKEAACRAMGVADWT